MWLKHSSIVGVLALSLAAQVVAAGAVHAQETAYTSKLNGKRYVFAPKTDEVFVRFKEGASLAGAKTICDAHNLAMTMSDLAELHVAVCSVSADNTLESTMAAIASESSVDCASPVYLDDEGNERYLDPRWLIVGFNEPCDQDTRLQIITNSQCDLVNIRSGYYIVSVRPEISIFQGISQIAASQEVAFAEPFDYTFDGLDSDTYLSSEWHLENTGQEQGYLPGNDIDVFPAWDLTYGSSDVVLVIIDTGIDLTHPDLAANIADRNGDDWNFLDPYNDEPIDTQGHGTGVAGAAAAIMNDVGVRGVAPGVKIMPLLAAGPGTVPLDRYLALNYAIGRADDFDAMVISCSWHETGDIPLIHSKVQQAHNAGIPVVFSAGSDNLSQVYYPARYEETVAVAAMDPCGEERKSPTTCDGEDWGSNYGPELDVSAPGVQVYTTDMQIGGFNPDPIYPDDLYDTAYTKYGRGTSIAAPQVSAVAALMLSINPDLSPEAIRAILHSSADMVGPYGYSANSGEPWHCDELGCGRIDAYWALMGAKYNAVIVGPAAFPTATWPYTDAVPNVYVRDDCLYGESLTIRPGTTVYFRPGAHLTMSGELTELIADASGGDPIVFTSAAEVPQPGDWWAVEAWFSDVTLRNCVIEYSFLGLALGGGLPSPQKKSIVEDVTFRENSFSQLLISNCTYPAWAEVKDCLFDVESPYGIWITAPAESVTIRNCDIYGSLDATYGVLIDDYETCLPGGGPTLVGNGIYEFDAGKGVYLTGGSTSILDGNVIWDPKWGIYCEGESQSVVNSESAQAKIIHCTTGLYVKDTAAPVVSNVSFENCTKYAVDATWQAGLDLGGGAGGSPGLNSFLGTCGRYKHVNVPYRDPYLGPVMAESNWWGSDPPNPGCISVGTVDYTPWLSYDPNPAGDGGPVTMDLVRPVPSAWQNYPNPFRTATTIAFDVPNAGARVKVRVFDSEGRLIRSLFDGPGQAGRQEIRWDGRNDDGRQMPAGVYFCNIEIGRDYSDQKKMILGR